MLNVPRAVRETLKLDDSLKAAAKSICRAQSVFFIGRGQDYAAAMEGALKLKEISYINANAYAAGELKHGTIAMIEEGTLVPSSRWLPTARCSQKPCPTSRR